MAQQGRLVCRSRLRYGALTALVSFAGSGCTYTTDLSAPGTLAVQPLGALPSLPPPASRPAVTDPIELPPSGTYEGTAIAVNNPGGGCTRLIQIRRFVVSGDRVRYLAFRGTIQESRHLRMQAGHNFIHGDFEGSRFVGRFWRRQPSCIYHLELDHVG